MKISRPRPPHTAPADGDGARRYYPRQRLTTARLQHRSPPWLICRDYHSLYCSEFPLLGAPPGTSISAAGEPGPTVAMRLAAAAAAARARAGE